MWRNKTISIINIVGLAIGFSIFLTFWVIVRYEKSYDTFHVNKDMLARLKMELFMNNGEYTSSRVGGAYAKTLKDIYPEVTDACRLSSPIEITIGVEESVIDSTIQKKYFFEKKAIAVDTTFFRLFSFQVVSKVGNNIFQGIESIVLTESLAKKIFGEVDPLGKTVTIHTETPYTVSAVVKDPPKNSYIQFSCLIPFDYLVKIGFPINGFEGTMFYTYLLLNTPESISQINQTITNDLHAVNKIKEFETKFYLEPMSRVRLHGEEMNIIGVYINTIIAVLMLFIACINFINLTTANSTTRIKEVGIRKVVGASRWNLIIQFLGETFVVCAIAFYIGIALTEQLLKKVSMQLDGNFLKINYFDPAFWFQISIILIITVLVSGLYPAFIVSRFKPADVFLRRVAALQSGGRLKRFLVIVQFTASVFFIVTTIFVTKQFRFMKTADLGFKRENMLVIPTRGEMWNNYNTIREELLRNPTIEGVATASEVPVNLQRGDIDWGKRDGDHSKIARIIYCDYDFVNLLEIKMVDGRFFSREFATDSQNGIVINKGIAEIMEWQESVGQNFYFQGEDYTVIGVTDNIKFFPFHFKAVSNDALIYKFSPVNNLIFVKHQEQNVFQAKEHTRKILEKFNPGYEFEYFNISDASFEALDNSKSINSIFWLITILGFFISSIGMFGLAIHSANRRIKEFGIRKSFGANSIQVYRTIVNEFLRLVLISNIIALPITWLALSWAFQFFAYRVNLFGWVFAFAAFASFTIALLTIGFIANKAARQNPIVSLRYE
jgi:ABC-type antimicrobial peptide transport system permease subunit